MSRKSIWDSLKRSGLCVQGGNHGEAVQGHVLCEPCLKKQRGRYTPKNNGIGRPVLPR